MVKAFKGWTDFAYTCLYFLIYSGTIFNSGSYAQESIHFS